ncbi:Uncharacterized protein YpmB [Evansella caseinilytica]|uniref:Uncharacterized protein YpmB n=1 Tax=Evansella caseinilytica TaxID=1503961 RepID=A0A1H3NI55_9BACI|nr:DUF5590 domain-containing protein [Evansella caseinilytica]SDY88433.1 Uncharacterized protein YpmB [Evansella caseinilytica]
MKRWIIAAAVMVFTAFTAFFYYMYNVISEPLGEREQEAVAIAKSETDLDEVTNVDYYHGRRSFQVIEGLDKDGEEMYVWVEELTEHETDENDENEEEEAEEEKETDEDEEAGDANPQIITRLKSDGLTESEVSNIAYSELSIKEIISIRLGIIGNTPVYEIVYVDEEDRHSFYYITFEDGTYIRHYQFRKT